MFFVSGVAGVTAVYAYFTQDLPDFTELEKLGQDPETTFETTKIYAWGDAGPEDERELVLIYEVIDPLGGSFFVEALTDEVEEEAMAYLEEIRELGDGSMRDGVLAGIESGYFHREIQEASYEYQSRVESGEETVVGVNKYELEEDTSPDLLHVDEEASRERQLQRLEAVKAERDDGAVEAALDDLRLAIATDANTMPAIIDAVKAYATMGEIMGVFAEAHGRYQETVGLA
jgi:methylmalonyl-CoA mutase N-terminal domain/subunit